MALTPIINGSPDGLVNVAFSFQFLAIDPAGAVTWSKIAGSLPPGLLLASDGTLSGTPTQVGDFSYTLQADDGATTPNIAITQRVFPSDFFRSERFLTDLRLQELFDTYGNTTASRRKIERHFFMPDLPDEEYSHDANEVQLREFPDSGDPRQSVEDGLFLLNTLVTSILGKAFAETTAAVIDSTTAFTDEGGGVASFLMNGQHWLGPSATDDAAAARLKFRLTDPVTEDEYTDDEGIELVITRLEDKNAVEIDPQAVPAQVDTEGFFDQTTLGPMKVFIDFSGGASDPNIYIPAQVNKTFIVNHGSRNTYAAFSTDAFFRKANVTGEVDSDIKLKISDIMGVDFVNVPPIDLLTVAAGLGDAVKIRGVAIDASVASPTNGDVLFYDGTNWKKTGLLAP